MKKLNQKTFDLNNCNSSITNKSESSYSNGSNIEVTTTTDKSKKIQKNIDDLIGNVVDLVYDIMTPTFLQSMLVISKDQLNTYKLHKIVLDEYNKYIEETCKLVEDISNKLSIIEKNYSFIKNNERRSRNLFPSFEKQLNKILLNYANEFGFKEKHQNQDNHNCEHHDNHLKLQVKEKKYQNN